MRHATSLFAVLLAALALSAAAPARADDESRLSGILQLDLTNAYFFRGILNERDGLIAQPWAELYVSLYSAEDGAIRNVTLGAGVWTSIHSEETLAADSPESVYETDLYPLLSVGFANGLTLTTTYYFYTSPNDAFDTVEELNFTLEWDDSEVFAFPLAPWVNVAIETKLTSLGDHEGTGVQFGIEPKLFELHERRVVFAPARDGSRDRGLLRRGRRLRGHLRLCELRPGGEHSACLRSGSGVLEPRPLGQGILLRRHPRGGERR